MDKLLAFIPGVGPFLGVAWSFVTSRIGSTLLVGAVCLGVGHHAGVTAERDRWLAKAAAETERQASASIQITGKANARERDASTAGAADKEKVEGFHDDVAKSGDCDLSRDDVRRLSPIGQGAFTPTVPARGFWAARKPAKPDPVKSNAIGKGAKSALAEYRAALAEANRRLNNDRAFYDDVLREFGEKH